MPGMVGPREPVIMKVDKDPAYNSLMENLSKYVEMGGWHTNRPSESRCDAWGICAVFIDP